jgi:hypothetical protein
MKAARVIAKDATLYSVLQTTKTIGQMKAPVLYPAP